MELPENWVWMGLSAASIYLAFFIIKFIKHRRFYKDLVRISISPYSSLHFIQV